jgi:hypothetical protein
MHSGAEHACVAGGAVGQKLLVTFRDCPPHAEVATHSTERVMKPPAVPRPAEHETEHAENGVTTNW